MTIILVPMETVPTANHGGGGVMPMMSLAASDTGALCEADVIMKMFRVLSITFSLLCFIFFSCIPSFILTN